MDDVMDMQLWKSFSCDSAPLSALQRLVDIATWIVDEAVNLWFELGDGELY